MSISYETIERMVRTYYGMAQHEHCSDLQKKYMRAAIEEAGLVERSELEAERKALERVEKKLHAAWGDISFLRRRRGKLVIQRDQHGDRASRLEEALNEFERRTRALPAQHEKPEKGCSTYNWRMYALREIRSLAESEERSDTITQRQRGILRHALGEGKGYRNHFVTGEGSDDYADCMALVDAGLMKMKNVHPELTGGDDLFLVTDKGKAVVRAESEEQGERYNPAEEMDALGMYTPDPAKSKERGEQPTHEGELDQKNALLPVAPKSRAYEAVPANDCSGVPWDSYFNGLREDIVRFVRLGMEIQRDRDWDVLREYVLSTDTPDPTEAPGHTDMLVTPESIPDNLGKGDPRVDPDTPNPESEGDD